jgi:tryptophan-rich sensory protein
MAGIVVGIAILAGIGTDTKSPWYRALKKPEWQPSPKWFAPVWFTIYLLLIVSAVIAWNNTAGDARVRIMLLFAINGVLNLAWSFIFFRARSPLVAGIDIVGLAITILLLMFRLWPISPVAALLLLPYLVWVCFASALNWSIARMN